MRRDHDCVEGDRATGALALMEKGGYIAWEDKREQQKRTR